MPDEIAYDEPRRRLLIGKGFVDNVPAAVWLYEVSGKRVLTQWFSYRKKNRERPIIGDRRPPSKLGDIQPDHWLAEYTPNCSTSCMCWRCLWSWNQPRQNSWRRSVKRRHLISVDELRAAGALDVPPEWRKSLSAGRKKRDLVQRDLFSGLSGDDAQVPEKELPTPSDADDEGSADELQ